MRSQTRQKTRRKTRMPGIVIIAMAIILVGLGVKAGKYVSGNFAGEDQPETSQKASKTGGVKARTYFSPSDIQANRTLSDYQMVIEKNLMERLGWQKTVEISRSRYEPVVQPQQRPEQLEPVNDLVLTGIVRLDGDNVAIVEDVSSGEAYFLKKGDKLKDYFVEAVTEKNMVLVNGDSRLTPALGSKAQYDSSGHILTTEAPSAQKVEAAVKDTGKSDATMSLIERMKAQRRRELEAE